jgi:hypothetical protein
VNIAVDLERERATIAMEADKSKLSGFARRGLLARRSCHGFRRAPPFGFSAKFVLNLLAISPDSKRRHARFGGMQSN